MKRNKFTQPGMRRVRMLLWKLYYQTPLDVQIEECVERGVSEKCKLTWEEYCALKAGHPDLWQRAIEKRALAVKNGRFPPQPPQLRRYRKVEAAKKKVMQRERPRFVEWAGRKMIKARHYKRTWLRQRVTDRILSRLLGE